MLNNILRIGKLILGFTPPDVVLAAGIIILLIIYSKQIHGIGVRGLAAVAVMCALAAAGGAALRNIPGVQPVSFIIIICGVLFGPGAGLCCGLVSSLLFDLLTTISLYTMWRLACWGVMGVLAAYLPVKKPLVLAAYGFVWGFVFGWIMNAVYYIYGIVPFTWPLFGAVCLSSVLFDLSHAVTNAVLLLFFSKSVIKILNNICPASGRNLKL